MRTRWIAILSCVVQMGIGWEFSFEYSHTMNALGKDHLFRGGITTPLLKGWALSSYGEANLFLGVPLKETNMFFSGSTMAFPYFSIGGDVVYRSTAVEEMQPYARFGFCVVWPHEAMTTSTQVFGLRGGVGMMFIPHRFMGLSVGIDFTGLMYGEKANKILTAPFYHHGIQVSGGISWRL